MHAHLFLCLLVLSLDSRDLHDRVFASRDLSRDARLVGLFLFDSTATADRGFHPGPLLLLDLSRSRGGMGRAAGANGMKTSQQLIAISPTAYTLSTLWVCVYAVCQA